MHPSAMPSAATTPAPRPCATLRPTMYAVSGPGVTLSNMTATINSVKPVIPSIAGPLVNFVFDWLAVAATAWVNAHGHRVSGARRDFPKFESLPFNNRRSGKKFAYGQTFATWLLQLRETQAALTTRNHDPLRTAVHNHARVRIARQFDRFGLPDLYDYAVERPERAGKRIEGSNLARPPGPRTPPVERPFVLG